MACPAVGLSRSRMTHSGSMPPSNRFAKRATQQACTNQRDRAKVARWIRQKRPPVPSGSRRRRSRDQHDHNARSLGVRDLCWVCRVRTRTHCRAHQGRIGGSTHPWPLRRSAFQNYIGEVATGPRGNGSAGNESRRPMCRSRRYPADPLSLRWAQGRASR